jgi:hypothetical protein
VPAAPWLAARVTPLVGYVGAAYGLAHRPPATLTPVARGAVGQISRLELGTERFAVKELFGEPDHEAVHREVAFTAKLAAAGVRLPASLPDRDGRVLVRAPAELGGRWMRLYEWVDGAPVDLEDPGLPGRLGELLGRLHANAQPPHGEVHPWYERAPDPGGWPDLAAAAQAAGAEWAAPLAERVDLLAELTGLVTPAAPDRLITCHRDLHPENVLVDGDGELVLLDWDDVGPADPDRELARLLLDWYVDDDAADLAGVRRTLEAYQAVGGPGWLRDERSFGMVIAANLNFLRLQARLALDPATTPEHRDYANMEILDGLGRLPTRALLHQLLETQP